MMKSDNNLPLSQISILTVSRVSTSPIYRQFGRSGRLGSGNQLYRRIYTVQCLSSTITRRRILTELVMDRRRIHIFKQRRISVYKPLSQAPALKLREGVILKVR